MLGSRSFEPYPCAIFSVLPPSSLLRSWICARHQQDVHRRRPDQVTAVHGLWWCEPGNGMWQRTLNISAILRRCLAVRYGRMAMMAAANQLMQ